MSPIIALARRCPGTSKVATFLLALLIGVASGFVGFGVAGARRTESAFSRFVAWSDPPTVATGSEPESLGPVRVHLPEVESLPIVEDYARLDSVLVDSVEFTPGHPVSAPRIVVVAQGSSSMAWSRVRSKVVAGKFPPPESVDQAVVDFPTADEFDLHVGDRFHVNMSAGVTIPITLAAVVSLPGSFPTVAGFAVSSVILPTGFSAAHPDWTDPWEVGDLLWLAHGDAGVDTLQRELKGIGLGGIDITPMSVGEAGANKVVRLESFGLWLAAAIAAMAGLAVIAQLQERNRSRGSSDLRLLRALGMTRSQTLLGLGLRDALTGLTGAIIGAIIAFTLSPLTPLGLARKVEIEPGFRFDPTAATLTAVCTVIAVTATGAVATIRQIRRSSSSLRLRPTPRLAGTFTEPVATGWRFAFGGIRRIVSGLLPTAVTLATLIGVVVTVQSVGALPDHPELTGGSWDAVVTVDDPAKVDALKAGLSQAPGVAAVARGGWASIQLAGIDVGIQALEPRSGVEPTLVRGRIPVADDEIALGASVLRELNVSIGSTVAFNSSIGNDLQTGTFRVVGVVITSSSLFQTVLPDHGGLTSDIAYDRFGDGRALPVLVKFEDHAALEVSLDKALASLPPGAASFSFTRSARGDVLALRSMVELPWLLVGFLGLMTVASIAQWTIMSSRRQRHDTAVLRALGWTRWQVSCALIIAGGLVAIAAAVVGIPAGILLGRWSWHALARFLIVVPNEVTPWSVCEAALAGVVITGLLLAALASGRQKRLPAADLRME